jgi:hypothetical protein
MKKTIVRTFAIAIAGLSLSLTIAAVRTPAAITDARKPTITAYKDPSCGCCKNWIEHLIKHGYRVDAKDTPNMAEIKRTLGVPDAITSCHTALVNGYLIEGHVPATDIDQLLTKKPRIAGLAVPGMPMGSPGMEGPRSQAYKVLAFDKSGKTTVFASH